MSDHPPPDVDFVVAGAGNDDDDEELPQSPGGPSSTKRRVLSGIAVAAVAAAVIARIATSSGDDRPQAGPTPSASATPGPLSVAPASIAPIPVHISWASAPASDVVRVSIPRTMTKPCPTRAACSVMIGGPPAVTAAVEAAFPDAIVRSIVTEETNQPGHFEPDLLAREITAAAGGSLITVEIARPDGAGRTASPGPDRPAGEIHLSGVLVGFEVTVLVTGPGASTEKARHAARALIADHRLVAE